MIKTLADYRNEIERVQNALKNTNSAYLKRDYQKYLKRLKREVIEYMRLTEGKV